jgi:outer membrane immunogenic protein
LLSVGPSLAADLPVKAAPVSCAGCNWNGFYFGINFGGSIGQNGSTDTIALDPPGTPGAVAPGVINPVSGTNYSQAAAGWLGGGQIGANWLMGRLLLGVEADWDWARQRDNLQVGNFIASSVVVAPASYGYTDEQTIKWLATARARIGWANGYTLAYLTGGAAWAGVNSNYTFQATGSGTFASGPGLANFSTTKTGWTLGSGVETSLGWAGASQWSAKIEYLYVDLGIVTNTFTVPQGAGNYTTRAVRISATISCASV